MNGTEYAFDGNLDQVVAVNLTNGNTTMVSNYDPSVGLIVGASPVPEPVSLALEFVGLAALALWRGRAKSYLAELWSHKD